MMPETILIQGRNQYGPLARRLDYAAELEELSANSLGRVKWKPPKVAEVVDRRVVVNPRQARELLTAVTYVGRPWRGRHLRAFFACMYFAALRPGEVKALRKDGCDLPATGWGKLTLSRSRPQSNKRWTDSGEAFDDRGLKHRAENDTRSVPIPPELVMILREQDRGVRDRGGWAAIQDVNGPDDLGHHPCLGSCPDAGPDPGPGCLAAGSQAV
jgi:integrase